MKVQDILFFIVLFLLFLLRSRPSIFAIFGILCIIFAIPLFITWKFFTAQHLVYYAAGFIFIGAVLLLLKRTK